MAKQILTQERLKELLHYSVISGKFYRKIKMGHEVKNSVAGTLQKSGYRATCVDYKLYSSHRLVFLYLFGILPEEVDHINHVRSDNRWLNLRAVTVKINKQNMSISSRNVSGEIGVRWRKDNKRWVAYIFSDGKHISLGSFVKREDAVKAREIANIKYGFHENHGKSHE